MEERIERAIALYKQGFNCSQSVCAAFADRYGFTEEQALRMSASFGGGIGQMRQTCGAACGIFILAGLHCGQVAPGDKAAKTANYELVQRLAAEFSRRNGSLICGELLGLASHSVSTDTKKPCVKMVEEAVRIWIEYLESEE